MGEIVGGTRSLLSPDHQMSADSVCAGQSKKRRTESNGCRPCRHTGISQRSQVQKSPPLQEQGLTCGNATSGPVAFPGDSLLTHKNVAGWADSDGPQVRRLPRLGQHHHAGSIDGISPSRAKYLSVTLMSLCPNWLGDVLDRHARLMQPGGDGTANVASRPNSTPTAAAAATAVSLTRVLEAGRAVTLGNSRCRVGFPSTALTDAIRP